MSLVTVLRSPSTSDSTSLGDSEVDEDQEDSSLNRSRASSFEGFFASKGAAYALPDGDFARRATKHGGEMQLHLQAMVNLLRDEDVLRLVVKLESQYPNRIRYLTIVSAFGPDEEEQSIVMGVDWTDKATIGLVVPLYRDINIKLDGDGGFKMSTAGKTNIFKPISVQTMWTALQWIHKCGDNARRHNYFYPNGSSHAWVDYYYRKISSDRLCLNEWHQMEDIESKRPESPIGTSKEKELVMKLIRHKLREVMMKVDLEDVTSRQVRTMLEEDTQMELKEYRSFIDEEMITILGQMDSASKIFDHVYLGSEWNASNLEELKENGVGYILNITREIDNFFPGTFHYHNIRVYDLDETELLRHWDNTYRFIQRAKNAGSKVLVHCRMGISRSASTVIAYGMKEYGWSLGDTMKYVKARRSVVQPNAGFWKQLITYEGILNSSNQRHKFKQESHVPDAGTTRKGKKVGNTVVKADEQLQPEGSLDTVDNLPMETEPDVKGEESSVKRNEDSEVVREIAEDTDDVVFSEDPLPESGDGDSVPTTSSPMNRSVESKEVVEEADAVQSISRVSEIIEKTALHRVSSVPLLPSDDKSRQESNAKTTANFQRSSSLRERGPRKVEHLRTFMEGKAASDENMTEFGLKKKGLVNSTEENLGFNERDTKNPQESKVTEKESFVEDPSFVVTDMEPNARGSLPRELHGVLESGFVKRKSRNFEEGVYNVPSVLQVLDDEVSLENEMEVEFAPGEDDRPPATDEEQDESTPSEEPEPGVVKKHREEYELKHRESLKRGAVLQRGGSGDDGSLKRERGDIQGSTAGDADSEAFQAEEGSDRVRAVNLEALVQKVNEDMKKEVSIRRISRKELELRAFVQQAGEQMEDALTNGEDGNFNRATDNSVTDLRSMEVEIPATGVIKRNTVKGKILEDPQLTGNSPECTETVASKGEMTNLGLTSTDTEQVQPSLVQDASASVLPTEKSTGERDASELSDVTSEQDNESVPQKGLVKRHTLLIEERLQPFGQKVDKEGEDGGGKEGEPTVEHEESSGLPLKGEPRGATAEIEPVQSSVVEDASAEVETESTEREMCDVPSEREDKASEEDTESVPQKGLVKRHTLLIEGRLQPLEQLLVKDADSEDNRDSQSKDGQDTCSPTAKEETRGVAADPERVEPSVDVEPTEKEKNATESKETCELSEEREDRVSDQDMESVPQKGLVKRHTLLIEGRLQPLGQELDKEGNNQDGKEDELTVDQETCSSLSKVETAVFDSELVQPSVAEDVSAEDKSTTEGTDKVAGRDTSEQGAELLSQKGLVKRHTLLIEGKLQPLDQDDESEDKKQGEGTVDQEVCSSSSVDQEQRYQVERTSKPTAEDTDEENQDGETVSGLVKREKLRIEERVKPTMAAAAEAKQDEDEWSVTCNDGTVLADDGMNESYGGTEKKEDEKDDQVEKQFKEEEQSEVGVDTSSVVRVKDHAQHLEGIIRVTTTKKGDAKLKSQTSQEDLPKSSDEPPKIVIIPRSCSDDRVDQENELSTSENLQDKMEEILSDSAVNIALMKAQENLDLENEKFVDWEVANVKQRTRIFEDIMRHSDKNSRKDDHDSDKSIRRCESLPKTIRPSQKYVLRRRSFSDLTETVSSNSGREVSYTIQFSNGESSSSSSLPRDWSPFRERHGKEVWDELNAKEVFSPEIYRQDELKEKNCVELIDCQDKENDSLSVKEKTQVLDSKNQRNISNIS